jgi:predicted acyl esterase
MRFYETKLRTGEYSDSNSGSGTTPTEDQGIWSVSKPLRYDAWFSGTPQLEATVDALPNANLAANVYDIAPSGSVTMISRGVSLLRGTGERDVELTLYGQDWLLAKGHRVGVLVSGANTDEFTHVPTNSQVTVSSAEIKLPFLTKNRTRFLRGSGTPRLERFLGSATSTLSKAFVKEAQTAFKLPARLKR